MTHPTGRGKSSGRGTSKERFVIVPEWIIDAEVSALAVRVWAVLRTYADNGSGEAWPSRSTLARRCRVSVDSVDRALKELVKVKALRITRRKGQNGEPLTNLFRLVIHTDAALRRRGGRTGAPTGSRAGARGTRPKGTITQLTNKSIDEVSVDYSIQHLLERALADAGPASPQSEHGRKIV
jgi:hypothetical protein